MRHRSKSSSDNNQLLTNVSDLVSDLYLIIAGEARQSVPAGDSQLYSKTACQGTEVSLSCPAEASISLVRAVWGRYSLAICNSGARDFLQMLRSTTCGDRVTPLSIITDRCQGKAQCHLLADTTVFGDPCPGVEEFLEVQFKCVETPRLEMVRRPEFADRKIAELWADNKILNLDQILFEELRAERVPITEASLTDVPERDGDVEMKRRSGERSSVMVVATVCLLLLPLIIVLTILILRTNSDKKSSCQIQPSHTACLSKPNLLFCRLESQSGGMTRKFSSEPSLVAHTCLLDSSLARFS